MKTIHRLLEKYSLPGPRYTSYPAAPYFSKRFNEKTWREELETNQNKERGLSLYFHIPFCDTLCYYCGCHMVATRNYSRAESYLHLLMKEIDLTADLISSGRIVRQIHWGGGTPTYLRPDDIRRLSQHIGRRFTIAPDAEIGCEVDPRELTEDHIIALKESGFNRLSLGVQDLDDRVQKSVNRIQPESLVRQVYSWMRKAGFNSINIDLMAGLPHQTAASFSKTLDKIIDISPDRLAVFNYAHLPEKIKHQKLIQTADLPPFSARIELQILIHEKLSAAGYADIGLDHFARIGDELFKARQNKTLWRTFQGYTTHKECDVFGFGVSGISQTEEVYAQNLKTLDAYNERISQGKLATERGLRVTLDDKIRREAIMQIMCDLMLDKDSFSKKWPIDFDGYFSDALPELKKLEEDGLTEITPQKIRVTETGQIFLRNIAMVFDFYLKRSTIEKPKFSQTV
ncbi:MAG: oxygen-independent coproporphyrinogen III oxidase [Nitrospirae bacterium]|nr:oxygen-independent coproporphyrinogen III oxidase [Nitrospirota bacterium]MBI3352129.1 oxygen-independent coproporphyrinogen III oxidase [Nitrospirota bacterium]